MVSHGEYGCHIHLSLGQHQMHKWLAMRIRTVPRPPWQHLAIEHSNCLNGKTSSNSYKGLIFHYQIRFLWENTTRQVLLLFRIRACSGHLPRVFSDSFPGAGRNISQTGPKGPPDFLPNHWSGVQKKKQLTLGRVEGHSPKLPAVEWLKFAMVSFSTWRWEWTIDQMLKEVKDGQSKKCSQQTRRLPGNRSCIRSNPYVAPVSVNLVKQQTPTQEPKPS